MEELFLLCGSSGADALEDYIRSYAKGGESNTAKGLGRGDTNSSSSGAEAGGGASNNSSKVIWSSKLTITTLRFTDCTNAGE